MERDFKLIENALDTCSVIATSICNGIEELPNRYIELLRIQLKLLQPYFLSTLNADKHFKAINESLFKCIVALYNQDESTDRASKEKYMQLAYSNINCVSSRLKRIKKNSLEKE